MTHVVESPWEVGHVFQRFFVVMHGAREVSRAGEARRREWNAGQDT